MWKSKVHNGQPIYLRLAGDKLFYITVGPDKRAALSQLSLFEHSNTLLHKEILIVNEEDLNTLKGVADRRIERQQKRQ